MTLIAVSLRQDSVEILTDTAAVQPGWSGRMFHADKVTAIAHRDAAIICAGNQAFGTRARAAIESNASIFGFDQLLDIAQEPLREAYAAHLADGYLDRPQRVILVGYSHAQDEFIGLSFDSDEDFAPRPLEPFHLQPMPVTHRPCPADLARELREAEEDGLTGQEMENWAKTIAEWGQAPEFPRPKEMGDWWQTAVYVREQCAMQEFNKTMVAGSAYLTRIERGSVVVAHLFDYDDTGAELQRLVAGTQHPVAQMAPCPACDSGKAFIDCHQAEQLNQPCGCGSAGLFRDCCAVRSRIDRAREKYDGMGA